MQSVSKEQAIKEVTSWLDKKRVRDTVRNEKKESIDRLVEYFENGEMSLDEESNEITYNLIFPLGSSDAVTKLIFKPRLSHSDFSKYSKNLAPGDTRGFINAKICALTGQGSGIINAMDQEDARAVDDIAIFFL